MALNDLERIIDYTIEHAPEKAQQIISTYSDNWASLGSHEHVKSLLLRLINEKGDVVTEALLDSHPDKAFLTSPTNQERGIAMPTNDVTVITGSEESSSVIRRYWQDMRVKLGILLFLLLGVIALLAWKYQD